MVSEEHLEAYVALEKEIHNMEKNKILQQLHCSVNELQLLIAEITELEATKQKLDTDM